MPTIKTKKEMNLPRLIEWGFENDIRNETYITSDDEGYELYFDPNGTPRYSDFVTKDDTFTVEVEEPITEDTVIDNLIEINELIDFRKEGLLGGVRLYKNSSINQVENDKSVAYYIMNDDLEMTLIWKRKEGLVE